MSSLICICLFELLEPYTRLIHRITSASKARISLLVFPRFAEVTTPQPKLGFFRICGVYYGDDENRSFKCNYVSTMYPAPRPFSRRTLLLPIKPLRRLKTIAFKSLCLSLSLDTVPAPWSWSTQGSITIIIKLSMFNLHKYYNKNFFKNQISAMQPAFGGAFYFAYKNLYLSY